MIKWDLCQGCKVVLRPKNQLTCYTTKIDFSGGSLVELASQCRRHVFNPWVGKIPWRRK